jgi:septal ring factor EnvC (AmiA/AmiB activator)
MKRISFNWEITAGHVMQAVVLVGAAVAMYMDARSRDERQAMRTDAMERDIASHDSRIGTQEGMTQKLSEAVVKLTTIVDERTGAWRDAREGGRGKAFPN